MLLMMISNSIFWVFPKKSKNEQEPSHHFGKIKGHLRCYQPSSLSKWLVRVYSFAPGNNGLLMPSLSAGTFRRVPWPMLLLISPQPGGALEAFDNAAYCWGQQTHKGHQLYLVKSAKSFMSQHKVSNEILK